MNVSPTLYAERLRHVSPLLYKFGAQFWIDKEYPRHLFIETTAACNLSCSYCPREKIGTHMSWETFTGVIDEASQYGPRSFSLHLFGEPTLWPRCFDATYYIHKANRRNVVLLTTNGTRLNQLVDRLCESYFDKVIWTWRPEAKFTPETKEKLRKWGKFMVRLIEEITPPEALEEWKNWQPQERKRLHNYGGNIPSIVLQELSSGMAQKITNQPASVQRYPCYHIWLAPAVAWNGNILMCCNDPHQKEVLGHFPEMSVHEAWASPRLESIRMSHLRGEYSGICKGCDSWKTYPDIFFGFQKSKVEAS